MSGKVWVIGIGPGAPEHMTSAARRTIETADVIVGYKTYLDLIAAFAPEIPRESSGMRHEVERANRAIDLAEAGQAVAVISGGDAGVYGMAGLIFEVASARGTSVPVEVVPGISALNAAAALLGAPLMVDFATISLSNRLVPLPDILHRLEMAARADFVIALYNPKGRTRTEPFRQACEVLLKCRPPDTPVGIVRAATREGESVRLITLADLPGAEVDMLTTVIIGSSRTTITGGKMVTARGYADKYALDERKEK